MSKKYHSDTYEEAMLTKDILKVYGIEVDVETGHIYYDGSWNCFTCEALYLMRHGKTEAVTKNLFMSDDSSNSHVTVEGKKDIVTQIDKINKLKFDVVVYASIARVKETAKIIQDNLTDIQYIELPWLKGINNGGWEFQTPDSLTGIDYADYCERELEHNIFAHSSNGCSWAKVLIRSALLVSYLSYFWAGKRVLIISQGSVLRGLEIILHSYQEPWSAYNPQKLYNLDNKYVGQNSYGRVQCIYDLSKSA